MWFDLEGWHCNGDLKVTSCLQCMLWAFSFALFFCLLQVQVVHKIRSDPSFSLEESYYLLLWILLLTHVLMSV